MSYRTSFYKYIHPDGSVSLPSRLERADRKEAGGAANGSIRGGGVKKGIRQKKVGELEFLLEGGRGGGGGSREV